jgi:hypothetical protein
LISIFSLIVIIIMLWTVWTITLARAPLDGARAGTRATDGASWVGTM